MRWWCEPMHSGPMRGYWKWLMKKFQFLIWNSKIWLVAVKMIDEKVPTLIWNGKIWLAAERAWDDDVSHCTVVQWGVIEND